MFRKILIAMGGFVVFLMVLVIAAGIIFMLKVDKAFIESRLAKALSRQVQIEKIDVGIFSIVSGMEVKKITISNFKTPAELYGLVGKPVSPGDVFAGIDALRLRVKILPLLKKQFDLKELILYNPVIHITRNKQRVLNCADLIKFRKQQPAARTAPDKRGAEPKEAPRPLVADNVPVAVMVGQIGIKNGTLHFHDLEFDQKFLVYKLTALAHDIAVDPSNLEKKNEIKLKIGWSLKTVGPMKTGSVQDFDITFEAVGNIKPFDLQTRQLDPELALHLGFPDGQFTGLQVFHAMAAIPLLGDYLGEQLSFLKGKQTWKASRESSVDVLYKDGKVTLSTGRLELPQCKILFGGTMQTETKALAMNLDMVMKKDVNQAVKEALTKKIDLAVRNPEMRKYADPDKLAEAAMQPLLNKDGAIAMKFHVAGTTRKSDVKMIEPPLDALDKVIKKSAGNLMLDAGKGAAVELVGEDRKKLLERIPDLFKK